MKQALIISVTISLALCSLIGVDPLLGGNSLYGNDNSVINSQANLLLGDKNTLQQSNGNLVNGSSNLLGLSNFNQIIGGQNFLANSQGNLVAGGGNNFVNSDQNFNLGALNTFIDAKNNFVSGGNNFIAGTAGNYIAGAGNNVLNNPQGSQPLPQPLPYPQVPTAPVNPPTINSSNLPSEGLVRFKADSGQYLRLCIDCGGAYPTAAASVESSTDINTLWKVIRVGDQISIQSYSSGNFLTHCIKYWDRKAYDDSVFVHLSNNNEIYSRWTPERQSNGKWAFRSENGKYLARCYNCAYTINGVTNMAFAHETNPNNLSAQWTLEY